MARSRSERRRGSRTRTATRSSRRCQSFRVTLRKREAVVDTGVGSNVLDSPALALAHLVELLAAQPARRRLRAGEVITTGTLTDAWPVASGETWSSNYGALPVAGLVLMLD